MLNKIQKIGVSAFIIKENKLLIVKRSKTETFLAEFYEIPGGKIEFGESPAEALIREVKEETNLDIKVIKPYSTFSYISSNGEKHTIDIQYIVEAIGNLENVNLSHEHDEYTWITKDEIDNFKFSEQMKDVIVKGFAELQ